MFFTEATSGVRSLGAYLGTFFIVVFAYFVLGQLPLSGVLLYKTVNNPDIGTDALSSFEKTMDFSIFGISSNLGLALMIAIFIFAMAALYLCVKAIHKLPFRKLITPYESINWNKILVGFGLWFVLAMVVEFILYLRAPELYTFNFKPGSFFILLLICFLLLPIQTSFEELFFRGYLMPGFALFSKNYWLPLLLSSVFFGLVHGMNPEVAKYGLEVMMTYYISAGLFLGLITIMDDSLELALGVHAATNIFGAAILSFGGSVLQTDSLFKASELDPYMALIAFYIAAIVFYFICSRIYGWPSISKIFSTWYREPSV